MAETMVGRTGTRPADRLAAVPAGPLAWQRTDVVGTELVFPGGSGTAVVHGATPYAMEWHAELADGAVVRELSVTCRGSGWSRSLRLRRAAEEWACHAEESGDAGLPAPGAPEPSELAADAVIRLADSPIFVTWAARRLGLTGETGAVTVPSVRVQLPSLTVVAGTTTYHLVGPNRLRVTGDGPATTYELDPAGVVAYQAGRLRLAR
ncbi:putative glycolipid-binding domain-containing protein [Actinoplanes sp. NPDC024001]|uniref:putative glycolipid-binding domain-containing protein n=1 Tax=Actinoplanes sp. NPDC024001 TaxID=3154598 RepID=UPI0033D465CE